MLKSYRYIHLDVFTDRIFGGNQLAVVLDGRGLSTGVMQAIAKEMNFSETTFVLPPERPDTDARVRIFTPAEELPMAGHPTIGTTYALAHTGVITAPTAAITLGLAIGPTPVSLEWDGEDLRFVWMTQQCATFGDPAADPAGAAAALRVPAATVTGTGLPVQVGSSGVPYLLVPLTTRRAVDSAVFDAAAFDDFRRAAGFDDVPIFLFALEPGADNGTVYSRMFAPNAGVAEDPATGSACGPLGCYLVLNKLVTPEKAGAMLNVQGVKMGRPSYIHIAIGVDAGRASSVRVGGRSVFVGEGALYL